MSFIKCHEKLVLGGFPILAGECVFYNKKMLLLKLNKKGNHDHGLWGPPSGHGEEGETPLQTATRETKEETNLDPKILGVVQAGILSISDGRKFLTVVYSSIVKDMSKLKIDLNEVSDYVWVELKDIESGKYQIRSESFLKPVLIKAFKGKPYSLDCFADYCYNIKRG